MSSVSVEDLRREPSEFVLVVEDCAELSRSLAMLLRCQGFHVKTVATQTEALDKLWELPRVLLVDVRLPDGSGVEVARAAAELRPAPAIIVMTGETNLGSAEAGSLLSFGTVALLPKPFSPDKLLALIRTAFDGPPALYVYAATSVGRVPMDETLDHVRYAMLTEAITQTGGNRTLAGKLLSLSRQAVQQMLAKGHRIPWWLRSSDPSAREPGGGTDDNKVDSE